MPTLAKESRKRIVKKLFFFIDKRLRCNKEARIAQLEKLTDDLNGFAVYCNIMIL